MRAVLVHDGAGSILRVSWTSGDGQISHEGDDGEPAANQMEILSPLAVLHAMALSWGEFGDAVKSACELSQDGSSLLRKSTGEVLSALEDLEA